MPLIPYKSQSWSFQLDFVETPQIDDSRISFSQIIGGFRLVYKADVDEELHI